MDTNVVKASSASREDGAGRKDSYEINIRRHAESEVANDGNDSEAVPG